MTETQLVGKIIKYLRSLPDPSWARKVHGSMYQDAGEPDVDAVVRGVPLKIEVKLPGKDPTPVQTRSLERWRAAGAVVGVARSIEDAERLVNQCRICASR